MNVDPAGQPLEKFPRKFFSVTARVNIARKKYFIMDNIKAVIMKRYNDIHCVNRVYEYSFGRNKQKIVLVKIIFVSKEPFIVRIAAVEREVG